MYGLCAGRSNQIDFSSNPHSTPLPTAGSLMVTRALGDAYLKRPSLSFPPYKCVLAYIT
jgi:hypothetical protein